MTKAELGAQRPEADSPDFMRDFASLSLGGLAKADFLSRYPDVSLSDNGQLVVHVSDVEFDSYQAVLDKQAAEARAKGAN